ncbi:hypothetical protein DEO72_LG10g1379 [Vigna unguiculata]|uniref:Uncharacterized protein n=1 Tax=Vigna unguiculata TaxID=3917 RepID=A0A4D6N8I9_VIGUN|nr:hypothetical protein DEO72_LG10g1379 [Vigna unguiculata]
MEQQRSSKREGGAINQKQCSGNGGPRDATRSGNWSIVGARVGDGKTNHIGGGSFASGNASASGPLTVAAPHPTANLTVAATNPTQRSKVEAPHPAATINGGRAEPSTMAARRRWQRKL